MTLRNRVSVAAAVGVLIVVAAVSSVLYFSYAASLHSRVDAALVDAAQQASSIAQSIKQSARHGRRQSIAPTSTSRSPSAACRSNCSRARWRPASPPRSGRWTAATSR